VSSLVSPAAISEFIATSDVSTKRGLVYTFYSYKGGVGRSMALANAAYLLARSGQRVLILDWDLEAPGIERFFQTEKLALSRARDSTPGVIDLILSIANGKAINWRDCVIEIEHRERELPGRLSLITAGRLSSAGGGYVERLRELDWATLFGDYSLGERIEHWRSEWISSYDVVLIDSRTGISDIGSICTVLLPDVIILVFTTSGQSVDGTADVIRRARAAQAKLPLDRARLVAVPLLSRDEREKEADLSAAWRDQISEVLGEFYRDWLPKYITPEDVLRQLYIPQIAFWSFGERVAAMEREEEIADARSIVSAYARLARLIQHQLDWTKIESDDNSSSAIGLKAARELEMAVNERRSLEAERVAFEKERFGVRYRMDFNWAALNRLVELGFLALALFAATAGTIQHIYSLPINSDLERLLANGYIAAAGFAGSAFSQMLAPRRGFSRRRRTSARATASHLAFDLALNSNAALLVQAVLMQEHSKNLQSLLALGLGFAFTSIILQLFQSKYL
jgi:Mrp family chromosome partitioning ATPase